MGKTGPTMEDLTVKAGGCDFGAAHAALRRTVDGNIFAGTHWWISPRSNTAGVLLTQRQMAFAHPFVFEFKKLAYQAVSGPLPRQGAM